MKSIAPSSNEIKYRGTSRLLSRMLAPAADACYGHAISRETDRPAELIGLGNIQSPCRGECRQADCRVAPARRPDRGRSARLAGWTARARGTPGFELKEGVANGRCRRRSNCPGGK